MRLCSCVLLAAVCSLAWAEPVSLDKDSFAENVATGKPLFVKFFAPWCGHCKRLAPTWEELSDKFSETGIATIAKVDCTVEIGLCADHGVRGYPMLKLFRGTEQVDAYQGARDLESLFQFIMDKVAGDVGRQQQEVKEDMKSEAAVEVEKDENGVLHLTDATFHPYISAKNGVQFVKFYAPWCGHCKRLAPTWEKLADRYHDDDLVEVAKVDCTVEKATCQRYGVKGYPTLILFADGIVMQKYSGSRTLDDLAEFIEDNRVDE